MYLELVHEAVSHFGANLKLRMYSLSSRLTKWVSPPRSCSECTHTSGYLCHRLPPQLTDQLGVSRVPPTLPYGVCTHFVRKIS